MIKTSQATVALLLVCQRQVLMQKRKKSYELSLDIKYQ